MKPTDAPKFAAMMTGLGKLYSKPITTDVSDFYWHCLADFSYEEVYQAVTRHVMNPEVGQFMPRPADIVRYIRGSSEYVALKAWTKVSNSISTVGGYSSVEFDDSIIHAVIRDMGGWIKLCHSELKQAPFLALEFQKRYQGYLEKPLQHYPEYLIGLVEKEAGQIGTHRENRIRISENNDGTLMVSHKKTNPNLLGQQPMADVPIRNTDQHSEIEPIHTN